MKRWFITFLYTLGWLALLLAGLFLTGIFLVFLLVPSYLEEFCRQPLIALHEHPIQLCIAIVLLCGILAVLWNDPHQKTEE